jgi:hypothetical protein
VPQLVNRSGNNQYRDRDQWTGQRSVKSLLG